MSQIHVSRIENKLTDLYLPSIDSHDEKGNELKIEMRLSKALAAYALNIITDAEAKNCLDAITDGFKDNGIDGLYIDKLTKTVYCLQCKWSKTGDKSPAKGDIIKFFVGIQDLLQSQFQKFNSKVRLKSADLSKALQDPEYKFEFLLVHTGIQTLAGESLDYVNSELGKLNDPYEIFSFKEINQKKLYESILTGVNAHTIELSNITLHNWGIHREPYESFYGEIDAAVIAKLFEEHGQLLLNKNIRVFKGITQVNAGIRNTITKNAVDFWYFNNGITMLCNGMIKSAFNGNDRTSGVFSFKNVSIVNGAQTYGSIGEAWKVSPEDVSNAKVQIRVINIENAPEDYSSLITRYNNTQNKIENKDFASLDPEQLRIKNELALDGIGYTFRTGDKRTEFSNFFDLEEATVALACAFPT